MERMEELEPECPCPNYCERHGDCVSCCTYHISLPYPELVNCLRMEAPISDGLRERVIAKLRAAELHIGVGVL